MRRRGSRGKRMQILMMNKRRKQMRKRSREEEEQVKSKRRIRKSPMRRKSRGKRNRRMRQMKRRRRKGKEEEEEGKGLCVDYDPLRKMVVPSLKEPTFIVASSEADTMTLKTGWKMTRVTGLRWPLKAYLSGGRGIHSLGSRF